MIKKKGQTGEIREIASSDGLSVMGYGHEALTGSDAMLYIGRVRGSKGFPEPAVLHGVDNTGV